MYTNIQTKTPYMETRLSLCSLYSIISASFPSVKVTQVQRIFFNDARGRDYVADLRLPECAPVEVQVDQKYYCLSAAAAVIKYMEFVCNAGDVYYLRTIFIAFLFVCPLAITNTTTTTSYLGLGKRCGLHEIASSCRYQ